MPRRATWLCNSRWRAYLRFSTGDPRYRTTSSACGDHAVTFAESAATLADMPKVTIAIREIEFMPQKHAVFSRVVSTHSVAAMGLGLKVLQGRRRRRLASRFCFFACAPHMNCRPKPSRRRLELLLGGPESERIADLSTTSEKTRSYARRGEARNSRAKGDKRCVIKHHHERRFIQRSPNAVHCP